MSSNYAGLPYYGGKLSKLDWILGYIDNTQHSCYVEPFIGGGAVFLNKRPCKINILNDKSKIVYNFWQVAVSDNKEQLIKLILDRGIRHEEYYKRAVDIIRQKAEADDIETAWAFYYSLYNCFSSALGAGYKVSTVKDSTIHFNQANGRISKILKGIQTAQIYCREASDVIAKTAHDPNALMYLDPPYIAANQAYLETYTQADFDKMLSILAQGKCQFLLSHYHNDSMVEYANKHGWTVERRGYKMTSSNLEDEAGHRAADERIEYLVYRIDNLNKSLFSNAESSE